MWWGGDVWSFVYIYTGVCLTDLEPRPWKLLLLQLLPLSWEFYTLTSLSLALLNGSSFYSKASKSMVSREGYLGYNDLELVCGQSPRCWYLESIPRNKGWTTANPFFHLETLQLTSPLDYQTNSWAFLGNSLPFWWLKKWPHTTPDLCFLCMRNSSVGFRYSLFFTRL